MGRLHLLSEASSTRLDIVSRVECYRKYHGHFRSLLVRGDRERAAELADPFLHAAHSDAGSGNRPLSLSFGRNPFALVAYFKLHGIRRAAQVNLRRRAARMAMDIG